MTWRRPDLHWGAARLIRRQLDRMSRLRRCDPAPIARRRSARRNGMRRVPGRRPDARRLPRKPLIGVWGCYAAPIAGRRTSRCDRVRRVARAWPDLWGRPARGNGVSWQRRRHATPVTRRYAGKPLVGVPATAQRGNHRQERLHAILPMFAQGNAGHAHYHESRTSQSLFASETRTCTRANC
jgi:hypothetical protein